MKTCARTLIAAGWLAVAAPVAAQNAMPPRPRIRRRPPRILRRPPRILRRPPRILRRPPRIHRRRGRSDAAAAAPTPPRAGARRRRKLPRRRPRRANHPRLPPAAARAATPPASDRIPMRFAVQTEAAIGVYPGDFYNHLAGVRLDLVFSPHVSFGGYVGYANLKGKDGRANNVLPYAQVEYMLGSPGGIRFPLRFASGYLPRNGPVVRLSAGFAFPLTPKIDLVTELLVPTIWITRDQMLLSMDLALELLFRL